MEFHNPFVGIQFDPSMFGPQHQKIVAEVNMLHATIKKEQQKTEQAQLKQWIGQRRNQISD